MVIGTIQIKTILTCHTTWWSTPPNQLQATYLTPHWVESSERAKMVESLCPEVAIPECPTNIFLPLSKGFAKEALASGLADPAEEQAEEGAPSEEARGTRLFILIEVLREILHFPCALR